MKLLYLSGFILAGFCQSASAQLVDRLGSQVDGVTRELEQVAEDVQEQIQQSVADELATQQLVDSTLSNPMVDPLILGLDRTVEDLARTAQDIGQAAGQLGQTAEELGLQTAAGLGQSLEQLGAGNTLAATLTIFDRDGNKLFVEVQVEDNWRAVEREWLMVLDEPGAEALANLKAEIIEQTQFDDLGLQLVRFKVSAPLDSITALKKYLPAHLHEQLDRNHIYNPQTSPPRNISPAPSDVPTNPNASTTPYCDTAVSIGMVDTGITTGHPAFARSHIEVKDFAGDNFDAPRAHGTAVAGVLVGSGEALIPLLPKARLFAASVFYPRSDYAQGATMISLVRALNWLVERKVSVINMSLAGPDNKILALAIQKTIQTGTHIVAAAGNDGPAAPPLFPAAYRDVIAVTAVDNQQRSYRWANRGDYIDFAALGVRVLTARSSGDYGGETGTSMAAPLITAAVACNSASENFYGEAAIIQRLRSKVIDLGAAGRDPIFGEGLINRP